MLWTPINSKSTLSKGNLHISTDYVFNGKQNIHIELIKLSHNKLHSTKAKGEEYIQELLQENNQLAFSELVG